MICKAAGWAQGEQTRHSAREDTLDSKVLAIWFALRQVQDTQVTTARPMLVALGTALPCLVLRYGVLSAVQALHSILVGFSMLSLMETQQRQVSIPRLTTAAFNRHIRQEDERVGQPLSGMPLPRQNRA